MLGKRTLVLAGSVVAVAAGSAGAIAATSSDEAKKAEAEVLGAAAKDLGVQSDALRKALADALDAQIDKAVKAGTLTQAQADAIKKRRAESGTLLPGPGLNGHRGGRGHGPGARGDKLAAAAKALGITQAELGEQLRSGKTIADVAKAEGKKLADVKAAIKKEKLARLDAAVKDGKLTKAQRDEMAKDIDARIDDMVNGEFKRGKGRRGGHHGPGSGSGAAPPADLEPGAGPALQEELSEA